jgi:hypothetical protein
VSGNARPTLVTRVIYAQPGLAKLMIDIAGGEVDEPMNQ